MSVAMMILVSTMFRIGVLSARAWAKQPLRPMSCYEVSLPRHINLPSSSRYLASTTRLPAAARSRQLRRLRDTAIALALVIVLYDTYSPFRHSVLAVVRCGRLMRAVGLDILDYKQLFAREEALGSDLSDAQRSIKRAHRRECHLRSANRLLLVLRKNSGIYVKLGQHVAAVQVLPVEWTQTMRPLQDQCIPTPVEEIDKMLIKDLGVGIDELFSDFDPHPIGTASLAQVHRAIDRATNRPVAVKLQHADLEEFAMIDLISVDFAIRFVKYIFPEFEFSWLGEEMNEMLPLEMDFRHEAANAARCQSLFANQRGKTSLYIPEVLWSERRCLVMEYIEGARVDDLGYLQSHSIDRNQVSQELSRIFSQMVYINGYFHADPHHGNLLIRPKAKVSASPFNFDVCLLDHGQYFDIPDNLRVNYAHFWLSLMGTGPGATERRKKYAKLVGNIDDAMYPILESAITGRINLADASDPSARPTSLLDTSKMGANDLAKLRNAMMEREGLVASIFELLRTVPRRLLMILKLSDLQRSLDQSLATTHGQSRIFLIVGSYCADAVWTASKIDFRTSSLSLHSLGQISIAFVSHVWWSTALGFAERVMDIKARWTKMTLWLHGLARGGLVAARNEMAGLRE